MKKTPKVRSEAREREFSATAKRDVPYQSLLKIFLAERIERELRGHRRTPARV